MEQRIRQTLTDIFDEEVARQATLDNLGGHASLRIYWRIHLPLELSPPRVYPRGETTLMAMVLPEGLDPTASAEGQSSNAPAPEELPFVDVQRYLADIGMPVPAIDRVDMERGVLILEDLGDRLFEHAVLECDSDDEIAARYREAIDLLVKFQRAVLTDQKKYTGSGEGPPTIAFERAFDAETLRWELDHYLEWGLQAQLGEEVVAPFEDRLARCFDEIVAELFALPSALVLRDFQSRNIMMKSDTWILIDFQDALLGPFIYDLVALLRDSYIELPPELLEPLVDYYASRGAEDGLPWCGEVSAVRRAFHIQTIQRKLKDAGRFIYIDRVKNNPDFLDYYGPSVQYVRHALSELDGFDELADILRDVEPHFSN